MFSIGVKTAIRFFVCTLACQVATGTYIAPKQQVRVSSAEVPVLIALFDYSNSNRPAASPEMLIEESSRSSPTLRVQLLERLSSPERTRLLLTSRKPREFIETRKSDDSEALLHSFVVLEYADIELAQSAHRRLRDDPAIRWIDFASIVRAAVVPNDPLWPSSALSHTGEAQWGVRTMNFEGGWSITGGNAYVGVVDNGIEATGARFSADGRSVVSYFGVHEDLRQNFRGHWASNHVGGYADVDENPIYFEGGDYPFNRFAGHGTHVAGTIAASSNNRIGATGTCMNCSLIVAKVLGRVTEHGVPVLSTDAELVAGIAEVIYRGAQIVNLSLTIDSRGPDYCLLNQFDPVCVVLSMAQARDVVVVAASGNRNTSGTGRGAVAFPANDPRVVAVGGVQIDQAGKVSIWDERLPPIGYQHRAAGNTLIGSGFGPELEVVAPARDVLSTFYTRLDWFPAGRCGDSTLFVDPEGHQATSSAGEGYGTCTGTSMAAPHVSGLFGLMRSLDPLATTGNIRLALARGSCIPVLGCGSMNRSDDWGFGVPNAAMVLDALVNTDSCGLNNRLTPLFSLNSHVKDYFYTTVPQMALVALEGMIRPLASYFFEGPAVPGYPSLPLIGFQQPSAQLYVFAGSFNPYTPGSRLVPLHRLSYRCGDSAYPANPGCVNVGAAHVDHTYATNDTDRDTFVAAGYVYEGIEGYLLPPSSVSQPPGTVAVKRRFHPSYGDFAIFPDSELASMEAKGYTTSWGLSETIGYAYPNVDTNLNGIVDGFEGLKKFQCARTSIAPALRVLRR